MAHYINPAFCQKSEFGESRKISSTSYDSEDINLSQNNMFQITSMGKCKAGRCEDMHQKTEASQKNFTYFDIISNSEDNLVKYQQNTKTKINTKGYALVPLQELCSSSKSRYTIIPSMEAHMLRNSSLRLAKSQDNLDLIPPEFVHAEEEDSFASLPAFTPAYEDSRKLISAFSSDFINKSMILVDQNNKQRYTIVPTDDDEDVVDSNHEIIEMYNGRAHRYAVIPTDEEEEFSETIIKPINTDTAKNMNSTVNGHLNCSRIHTKIQPFKPINESLKNNYIQTNQYSHHSKNKYDKSINYNPGTPTKNPIATQKLHELLCTPRKSRQETFQRQGSYQTIIQRSPDQFQLQKLYEQSGFTPQKLEYEDKKTTSQNVDNKTTAIISPRLSHQQAVYSTLGGVGKHWAHESFQKIENATATIGVISLMLILTGVLNSGLCLYLVTDVSMNIHL